MDGICVPVTYTEDSEQKSSEECYEFIEVSALNKLAQDSLKQQ